MIDRVEKHVEAMGVPADATRRVNVIDLCSGFGYLGMFLSELLDPRKVKLIVLLDKQWPMYGADPAPHQINWDHVYGIRAASTTGERSDTYEWTPDWPVPLRTRKMDLKQAGQLRQMETLRVPEVPGAVPRVLAVHLCGTLSVKAVEMFNAHDTASMLCLKPCCLPEWNHTYTHDAWVFPKTRDGDEARRGSRGSSEDVSRDEETPRDAERSSHAIPTTEVCAPGKWKNNRWIGPPRARICVKSSMSGRITCVARWTLPRRKSRWSILRSRKTAGTRTRSCSRSGDVRDDAEAGAGAVRRRRGPARARLGRGVETTARGGPEAGQSQRREKHEASGTGKSREPYRRRERG